MVLVVFYGLVWMVDVESEKKFHGVWDDSKWI